MKAKSPLPPPPVSPKARPRRPWLLIGGTVGLALILLSVFAIRLYPAWNQDRLILRARAFMGWKDYKGAAITARRALQLNERSVPAVTLLAEIAENQNSGGALYWRRRLVDLQPENVEARVALAERALALRKLPLAKEALAGISEKGKKSARYHYVSGLLARALGKKPAAEAEFARAAQMEPANSDYQIDLASLQVESEDETVRTKARQALDEFCLQPATLARAAPALIRDAVRRGDKERAISLANTMRLREGASSNDSLYYLQLLHELKHPGFTAFLTELEEKAADSPERVYALVSWMSANHLGMVAILWCKQLRPEIVNTMPVPMALARCYAAEGKWEEVKPLVENPEEPVGETGGAPEAAANSGPSRDWKSFDFMRLALLAHALRDHGNADEWKVVWSAAVKSASDRPAAVAILARAAVDWRWDQESTDLLWAVARGPSDQMWALKILYATYQSAQATRNMLQVLTRMYEVEPTDVWVRHNLACLWFLLETNLDEASKIAEDLHREDPKNPASISLLAFARYMQGSPQEALDLMRQLGEERLRQPEYAAYFGVMLAGSGERDKAKEFLRIAGAASLLPEERNMVERAVAGAR